MSSTLSAVRRSRIPALAAAVCTVAAGLTLGLPAAHAVPASEWSFDTPGHSTWTVPDGVTMVYIELWGATGGTAFGRAGGSGAYVDGEIDVTPGDTYEIFVGGTGDHASLTPDELPHAGGFNGGADGGGAGNGSGAGGGGATDVRFDGSALGDRIMAAGGGGGASGSTGGNASDATGEDGAEYGDVLGGGGATPTMAGGGAIGVGPVGQGADGALGVGGAGLSTNDCRYGGGGGGGGLYGGGGGGCMDNAGGSGGGAGSSLVPEDGYVEIGGDNPDEDEDGYALISLLAPDAPAAPNAIAGDGSATVSWSAPEFIGSMEITGYTVAAEPGGATCTTDGALSCEVDGLTNGTAYTFTVVATSDVGDSEASPASGPVTPQIGTIAPTVVFPKRGAFLSSWTVLRTFGSPVATVRVSTPSICRASGASVVFLRAAGTCRVAVMQDGDAIASASIPVAAAGSGAALTTKLIRFRGGSTFLTHASKARLTTWAPVLRDAGVVVVTGWVSGMRTTGADRRLSQKRAQVVVSYLRGLGVHVTARYGAGSHWLGTSGRSRAADVSWYAAPTPV